MLEKLHKLQPYLVHAESNKTNSMLCMPMQYIIKQNNATPCVCIYMHQKKSFSSNHFESIA